MSVDYNPQSWSNNDPSTPLSAARMLVLEAGIDAGTARAESAYTLAAAAVPKSTVTTKGDLIVATASGTVSRLAAGTDAQVLTRDATTTTGLRWATPSSSGSTAVLLAGSGITITPTGADYTIAATGGSGGVSRTLTKRSIAANYTLVLGDELDMMLHTTAATAVTITIPENATAAIPQENVIPWRQYGAGIITFAPVSGNVTLRSRGSVFKSAGQYAEGSLTKVAANVWVLSGDIAA